MLSRAVSRCARSYAADNTRYSRDAARSVGLSMRLRLAARGRRARARTALGVTAFAALVDVWPLADTGTAACAATLSSAGVAAVGRSAGSSSLFWLGKALERRGSVSIPRSWVPKLAIPSLVGC